MTYISGVAGDISEASNFRSQFTNLTASFALSYNQSVAQAAAYSSSVAAATYTSSVAAAAAAQQTYATTTSGIYGASGSQSTDVIHACNSPLFNRQMVLLGPLLLFSLLPGELREFSCLSLCFCSQDMGEEHCRLFLVIQSFRNTYIINYSWSDSSSSRLECMPKGENADATISASCLLLSGFASAIPK